MTVITTKQINISSLNVECYQPDFRDGGVGESKIYLVNFMV